MSKKSKYSAFFTVGAVVVFAVVWWNSSNDRIIYKLAPIKRGTIEVLITTTGTIKALEEVQVGPRISGRISRVYVDYNQKVKRDQVLAEIDPTFARAELAEAEASLEKARTQLTLTERTYERAAELLEKEFISQAERDEAATQYELAQATYKQSKAKYNNTNPESEN